MKVQPLTKDDILKVQKILSKKKFMSERNQLLFLVGINYCLRAGDIASLTLFQVLSGKIKQEKTKKYVAIPKFPILEDKIKEYCLKHEIGVDKPIFQAYREYNGNGNNMPLSTNFIWRLFSEMGEKIGKNMGSHTMRKTGGRQIYEATGDIRIAQQALGHSNPISTACYIGLTDDEYAEKRKSIGMIGI